MYNEVNLSRHAKSKRKVSKKDMCQRNAEYGRNKSFYSIKVLTNYNNLKYFIRITSLNER